MNRYKIFGLFFLLAVCFQAAYARDLPASSSTALEWLKKMADAPRQHDYAGTFVYFADDHIETTRILHKADDAGERERIEVLDGSPRIVFRNNDEMKCYLPENKKVYTEKRWFRKFFPNLLPQSSEGIDDNYYVKEIKRERVTERECQVLLLTPRDDLRYGHQFWIDIETGLLLKVAVLDGNDVIEQFSFVQIEIDKEIPPESFKLEQSLLMREWHVTDLVTSFLKEGEMNWKIRKLPAGFKKLIEMRRNLTEKSPLVDHVALSDGLATVSIFIESLKKDVPPPASGFFTNRGAINIYVRTQDDHKITTVGEVPVETIKLIGDSVVKHD